MMVHYFIIVAAIVALVALGVASTSLVLEFVFHKEEVSHMRKKRGRDNQIQTTRK